MEVGKARRVKTVNGESFIGRDKVSFKDIYGDTIDVLHGSVVLILAMESKALRVYEAVCIEATYIYSMLMSSSSVIELIEKNRYLVKSLRSYFPVTILNRYVAIRNGGDYNGYTIYKHYDREVVKFLKSGLLLPAKELLDIKIVNLLLIVAELDKHNLESVA